jgi:hypothetical protein
MGIIDSTQHIATYLRSSAKWMPPRAISHIVEYYVDESLDASDALDCFQNRKPLLNQYFALDVMRGVELDVAFRSLLSTFVMPTANHRMKRVLQAFAQEWALQNPLHFISGNSCQANSSQAPYLMLYSMIVLNADAHSPQVKTKMSQQQFCRSLVQTDLPGGSSGSSGAGVASQDLPRYLEGVFVRITASPLPVHMDDEQKPRTACGGSGSGSGSGSGCLIC